MLAGLIGLFTPIHRKKQRLNLDYFIRIEYITSFGLFEKDSHLTLNVYHFVCEMLASLLDHRLQHGSPGRTKRAICLFSASVDYPTQDHPA